MKKTMYRKDAMGNTLNKGESFSRSTGRYRFAFTDMMGKRHEITAKSLCLLREKEKREYLGLRSDLKEYGSGELTLNDAFDIYMGTKSNIRQSTRDNYYYMYDRFVRPRFGTRKLAEYRYSDVMAFYHDLVRCGLKYNTLDNIQSVVYPSFQMAYKDRVIDTNPADGAKAEIKRATGYFKTRVHPITKTEQEKFLSFIRKHEVYGKWYAMFTFMFGTGVRIGELAALTWDDIDFDENCIYIRHAISYERHVSGEMAISITSPKTESGKRTIPMLPEVRKVLMVKQDEEIFPQKPVIEGLKGFVFINKSGRLMNQNCVNRAIRRIVDEYNDKEASDAVRTSRRAVFLPHFTTHRIRHTFCSRLCENESNIKIIQSVMGHTDIRTTFDIYAEVSNSRIQKSFSEYGANMGVG